MNDIIRGVLTAVSAYLLGSINCSIIVSRLRFKTDIRKLGSGNAGMTNSLRSFGMKWTIPVIIGDLAKGVAAVLLGGMLLGDYGRLLAGVCVVLGHIFPVYFGFAGGKGVLTSLAMIVMVDWRVALICFAAFALIVLITRYVSLGSMAAACGVLPVMWVFHPGEWNFAATSLLLAVIVVYVHRENIKRLLSHTENKLSFKKK